MKRTEQEVPTVSPPRVFTHAYTAADASHQERLSECESEIAALHLILADARARVFEINSRHARESAELRLKFEQASVQSESANAKISELELLLQAEDIKCQTMAAQLQALEEQATRQAARANEAHAILEAVFASKSWRISNFLRKPVEAARRTRQAESPAGRTQPAAPIGEGGS